MQTTGGRAPQPDFEFRDYLSVLRRRRLLVFVVTVIVVLAGVVFSAMQPKTYEATGAVLIQLSDPSVAKLETETRLIESEAVSQLVRAQDPHPSRITARSDGASQVIRISATDSNANKVANSVNAYLKSYVEYKRQEAVDQANRSVAQVQDSLNELNGKIAQLEQTAASQPNPNPDIDRERSVLVSQRPALEQQLHDAQRQAAQAGPGAQVITPASTPSSPTGPRPIRDAAFALIVGLLIGIGAAFIADYLRETVDDGDDVLRVAGSNVPLLSLIPVFRRAKRGRDLISISEPQSPAAEAYRALRTSLQFVGFDRSVRTIEITSAAPGEGKSTTLANLAVLVAGTGQAVVIVDCDLRHPGLHDLFGIDNEVGLTDVLRGEPISTALRPVPGVEFLSVMTSGPTTSNPAELLASRRWVDVLSALREEALVLVDTPPMLPFTDAAVLAAYVDAVVLVAAAGRTSRKELRSAVEFLRQIDAPLIGVVLNEVAKSVAPTYDLERYYTQARSTKRGSRLDRPGHAVGSTAKSPKKRPRPSESVPPQDVVAGED
jgi:non-specific protein-tyrosine kinase